MKIVKLIDASKEPCSEFWNGIHVLDAFSVHCDMKLWDAVLPLLCSFTVTECKEISRVGNEMGRICFWCVLLVLRDWAKSLEL